MNLMNGAKIVYEMIVNGVISLDCSFLTFPHFLNLHNIIDYRYIFPGLGTSDKTEQLRI